MDEDATAAERLLPGVPSGGDSRLLGIGELDITSLCLGETPSGEPQVVVMDAWIPIAMPQNADQEGYMPEEANFRDTDPLADPVKKMAVSESETPACTGRVRVLVSYQPHGLDPQENDIVALEAFARWNPAESTCRPIMPPLLPLYVLDRKGSYLLVEHELPETPTTSGLATRTGRSRKACMRLHRNAVFVIERKNLMDAGINLAMLPADVWMSTPVGQKTAQLVNPVVIAGRQLMMPALLSLKLVWVAVRTTAVASWSGVQATAGSFWNESTGALTRDPSQGHIAASSSASSRRDSRGNQRFVQL